MQINKLDDLNSANEKQAAFLLEPLIERAPGIASNLAARRPFESVDDLRAAIKIELLSLNESEMIDLFRAHPELAPENPLAMTSPSQSEQGRLNLTSSDNEYRSRLAELNASYRAKFGFPFIIALVRHENMESVLIEFELRLESSRKAEIDQTIEEIATVSSSRVRAAFS